MESLVNFRDLGGRTGFEGRKVQKRRLLRSGQPCGLSESDIQALQNKFQLRAIVDFRTITESKRVPVDPIPGSDYYNFDLLTDFALDGKHNLHALRGNTVGGIRKYMAELYIMLMHEPSALSGYRKFIELLLNLRDGSVLFHCFAGKDRTGIAAAMVYSLLGVDNDAIMRDYLRTNRLRRAANQEFLERARLNGKTPTEIGMMRTELSVRAQYLSSIFTCAQSEFGSFFNMVRAQLHITDKELELLRDIYLEKGC